MQILRSDWLLPQGACFTTSEISGGCEKILPVSGSFRSNLKFFRMIDFTAWL